MIIDVVIALITLLFVFLGFKNGFVRTFLHTFGWIAAITIAFFLRNPFAEFLEANTSMYSYIYNKTEKLLSGMSDGTSNHTEHGIPGLLSNDSSDAKDEIVNFSSEKISDVLLVIISFLIILILFKIFFFAITLVVSKKYRKNGFTGKFDGLLGALFGFAQAAFLVFVLLAIMLPVSYLISESIYDWIVTRMDQSVFSQYLYEHNPLLVFIKEYVPSNVLPADWF